MFSIKGINMAAEPQHEVVLEYPSETDIDAVLYEAKGERLRRIEAWCADWQIGVRVIETLNPAIVRIAFEDPRFARAFTSHFGGVVVPPDDIERALTDDAVAEDAFDRLAMEYDVED